MNDPEGCDLFGSMIVEDDEVTCGQVRDGLTGRSGHLCVQEEPMEILVVSLSFFRAPRDELRLRRSLLLGLRACGLLAKGEEEDEADCKEAEFHG